MTTLRVERSRQSLPELRRSRPRSVDAALCRSRTTSFGTTQRQVRARHVTKRYRVPQGARRA